MFLKAYRWKLRYFRPKVLLFVDTQRFLIKTVENSCITISINQILTFFSCQVDFSDLFSSTKILEDKGVKGNGRDKKSV